MKRYRPVIPEEEMEEEAIGDDDAEVTVNKVEEEMIVSILDKGALIFHAFCTCDQRHKSSQNKILHLPSVKASLLITQ